MEEQNKSQAPNVQPENQFDPEYEAPTMNEQAVSAPEQQAQPLQSDAILAPRGQEPVAAPAVLSQPQADESSTTETQPATVATPPKSKKKWLVPIIALGIIVLSAGSASAYYVGVYQNPQNVLMDAYNKMTAAKAIQSDSTITLNQDITNDLTLKDIKIRANSEAKVAGMLDATINMEYKGKVVPVGGKGVVSLTDSALYFQVNNLKQAVTTVVDAEKVTSEVPAGFLDSLGKLQDQWVKVTIADLKKNNQSYGSKFECAVNAVKKHASDSNEAVVTVFKKSPFITVKDSFGVKDGLMGYKLAFDEAKAKEFTKNLEATDAYKDIKACNLGGTLLDPNSTVDGSTADNTVYTVWVDQWSHELRKVEFSGDSGAGTNKTTFSGNMAIAYDSAVRVAIPTAVISWDEFVQRYDSAATKAGIPDSSMFESPAATNTDITNDL